MTAWIFVIKHIHLTPASIHTSVVVESRPSEAKTESESRPSESESESPPSETESESESPLSESESESPTYEIVNMNYLNLSIWK